MGCSPGDGGCNSSEKPAHEVTLTKGFWIGQTEVTQAAYQRLMGGNPSHFKGVSLPVEQIRWKDAQSYCQAAGMRLPTEAEWEYAARGGNASARYGAANAVAWYEANSEDSTHEVGQKQANGYGLYDTLGNVWEWVADWYGEYSRGSQQDPHGPPSGRLPTRRGGSSGLLSWNVRVSYRSGSVPEDRDGSFGVRCAGD
jgi:formylglycine-generating enzyme required for sulfatase activity